MNKTLLFKNKTSLVLLATMVWATSLTTLASKSNTVTFHETTITSPYKLTQEVITANILSTKGKELVTFSVDDLGNRWLIIYKLNKANQYVIAEKSIIPKQFYRFDLSKAPSNYSLLDVGGTAKTELNNPLDEKIQTLYFISANALFVYQNEQFKKLINFKSLYVQEQADLLSRGNFIQDLNNDLLDDVIIAGFHETSIFIGQGLSIFAKQMLPIKPNVRTFSAGATYTERKLYFADVNFDKKTDVFLIGEGEMIIYPQQGASQFIKKPIHVNINEAISGIDWWDKRDESGEPLDQSHLEYRKLEALRDINADGITDMVIRYTKASGVLDRVNDYEIFLGKNNDKTLSYAQTADSIIHAEGTLTDLVFVDIDNDEKLEVLLAGFDIGLSQIIGALVSGAIDQDVYIFKMDEQDTFLTKPVIKKDVELTFSLSSGQSGSGVAKLADLNGDGLKELVLSNDDDELKIYLGKKPGKNKKRFKRRSVRYNTKLPKEGKRVMVEDLNGDGKEDLLMKFSRLDGENKAKQIKILFSQ